MLVCVAHLLYAWPCIAFPLLQIKHLFSVIFCRCMGVLCCYFRPKMFSPGDHVRYHSRTLGAHVLATVVGPSPNGPHFCHIWYIRPGGVTPVDHESAQLSRLQAVAVESPLQSPRETVTWQPSPPPTPTPGDRRALTRQFARGGGGQGSGWRRSVGLVLGAPSFVLYVLLIF